MSVQKTLDKYLLHRYASFVMLPASPVFVLCSVTWWRMSGLSFTVSAYLIFTSVRTDGLVLWVSLLELTIVKARYSGIYRLPSDVARTRTMHLID